MGKILNAIIKIQNLIEQHKKRKGLKDTDFCVISNNCWAGTAIYQPFGLRYNTPTVGLFIMDEDYICFLERLDYFLQQTLQFIRPEQSKYYNKISRNGTQQITYPIGVLDNQVEIHFLHYHSVQEASEKWLRRIKRINHDRLIIKMSLRDEDCNMPDIITRFMALPFSNKICFSPIQAPDNSPNIIHIPELSKLNLVGGDETEVTLARFPLLPYLNSLH